MGLLVVRKEHAWLSGPCSACDSRSAAMKAGSAAASAMTSTCTAEAARVRD